MSEKEKRKKILNFLYEEYHKGPYNHLALQVLQANTGLTNEELKSNLLYLEQKGHVKLLKAMGGIISSAIITADGIDEVEGAEEKDEDKKVDWNGILLRNILKNMEGIITWTKNMGATFIAIIFILNYFTNDLQTALKITLYIAIVSGILATIAELKKGGKNVYGKK